MPPPTDTIREADVSHASGFRAALDTWTERNPLRVWRADHGHSQATVAHEVGVSATTVRAWERGHHMPPNYYLDRLSTLTATSVDEPTWSRWYAERPRLTPAED